MKLQCDWPNVILLLFISVSFRKAYYNYIYS